VLLFLYALGLYRREALVQIRRLLGRLPVAAGLGALTGWMLALLPAFPGAVNVHLLFAASVPCFAAACLAARLVLYLLGRRGAFRRRLFVVGAGRRAWDLVWILQHEARTLAFDVTFLHAPSMGEVDPRLAADPAYRIVSEGGSLLETVANANPDQIVVAPDERRGLAMEGLLACKMAGFPVSEYTQFVEREIGRIDLKRLDLAWLLYTDGFTMGTIDRVLKRLVDIAASTALLLFTAPLLLMAALAVKLSDGGPVLYRQVRVTQGERLFGMLKLRSMTVNAEAAGGGRLGRRARPARDRDRPLPAAHPPGRAAAAAQRAEGRHVLCRPAARAARIHPAAGDPASAVPGAAPGALGPHRLGAGELPLRRVAERRPLEVELRPVLREELRLRAGPADHAADRARCVLAEWRAVTPACPWLMHPAPWRRAGYQPSAQ
jgi:hypothetical protein